ncbi:MAG TPA: ATP synthase F0 subunit B [Candidatus Deferrimicrobiaceae bacterium]|nr:ATP synthase F0 subunit B [Candidatus Deferrimicrobiaceae bacterium]
MELVGKIFETLGISQIALLQMVLVVALVFLLSVTLVRPILATFQERENRAVRPVEESRTLLAQAEGMTARYEESLRKAAVESLAAKRKKMEEAGRLERKKVDAVLEESNRHVDEMRVRIEAERVDVAKTLRAEVSRLSVEIAAKVLGRPVA